jgi:hypothetical protein
MTGCSGASVRRAQRVEFARGSSAFRTSLGFGVHAADVLGRSLHVNDAWHRPLLTTDDVYGLAVLRLGDGGHPMAIRCFSSVRKTRLMDDALEAPTVVRSACLATSMARSLLCL